jgi:outer membrane lipoprotein-sorting protein
MIDTRESNHPDFVLARAVAALRRMPVPTGPSEETAARILTILHAASGWRPPVPRRWKAARQAARVAALVLATGLCFAAGTWIVRPASAFAVVAQKLRAARTLSYRTTVSVPGKSDPITSRTLLKAPGLIRCEVEPSGGSVTVYDAVHNRTLVLDPTTKLALLLEGSTSPDGGPGDMAAPEIEALRKLADSKGEPVGRRRIGHVEAEGFHVRQAWQDLVVWIDPHASLPVRIEWKARVRDVEFTGTLDDIRIDPSLDDALFRFEPPAGYALSKGQNPPMSDEESIADLLRMYATHAEGAFPPRFDDWAGYRQQISKGKSDDKLNIELLRLAQTSGRLSAFLLDLEGNYGYTPEGVRLGDSDKVLFWYRPKGSDLYRAIFGDLHAADSTPSQLPQRTGP